MNPFTTPDAIYISKRPQDMRAGIQRLAAIAAADFGRDPMDGALYCFVSRDCKKAKLLRSDVNGWCMYYVRLAEGGFKWRHAEGGRAAAAGRAQAAAVAARRAARGASPGHRAGRRRKRHLT